MGKKKITTFILEFSHKISDIIGCPILSQKHYWFTDNYYISRKERKWYIKSYIIWEVKPSPKYCRPSWHIDFPNDWYAKIDGGNTMILPHSEDQDKILDELIIAFNEQRVNIPIHNKSITDELITNKTNESILDRFHILDLQ